MSKDDRYTLDVGGPSNLTATEYVSEAEVNSADQTKAFAVLNLCLVPSLRIRGSAAPNRSTAHSGMRRGREE